MTEQLPDKQGKKEIPVQWENPSSENQLNGVMFLPGDKLGLNQIEWVESKTKFKTSMEVKEDALSGQIILSDDGKPVLRYNYKTVYEKDALDTLPANSTKKPPQNIRLH